MSQKAFSTASSWECLAAQLNSGPPLNATSTIRRFQIGSLFLSGRIPTRETSSSRLGEFRSRGIALSSSESTRSQFRLSIPGSVNEFQTLPAVLLVSLHDGSDCLVLGKEGHW